ncbi:MAG: hypothetical protein Q7U16_02445 [Agitococcus sp.]|nr:hypothetical protein [Agitococcus sp.]
MAKLMEDVLLIDEELMHKYPPLGCVRPHRITVEDSFLKELREFENALKKQEVLYDDMFGDLYRDEKYLTQKIEILTKFSRRCEKFRDVLSEDLDFWEVTRRLT